MSRKIVFPLLIPVLLLFLSFWRAGVHERYLQAHSLRRQAAAAQSRLDELQAISVAARIDQRNHDRLVVEFAQLAGLDLEEEALSKGRVTGEVARLVDAVVSDLHADELSEDRPLLFRSVTPGQRHAFEPFLAVDFELNLEGRFFALSPFLARLSSIAQEQRCAISIGELRVASLYAGGSSGELSITLPLRAYFLDR